MSSEWFVECGVLLPNGFFKRNEVMEINKVTEFRFKYDNIGVFATAYMYDSKDQNEANLYGDLYIDLDYDLNSDEAFEVVRKDALKVLSYMRVIFRIPYEDINIYFSGSKGIHIIIPKEVLGIQPMKDLNRIYKLLVEDIVKLNNANTIDLKIYDRKRLFRLVNSRHPKTGLYKIQLSYTELKEFTFEQIKDLAKSPRPQTFKEYSKNDTANSEFNNYVRRHNLTANKPRVNISPVKLDYVPPCIHYLLTNQILQGNRNHSLALLTSYYYQTGHSKDEAENELGKWNDVMVNPSINEIEMKNTIDSIFNGEHKYGCSTAKGLSVCDKRNCKFNKEGF